MAEHSSTTERIEQFAGLLSDLRVRLTQASAQASECGQPVVLCVQSGASAAWTSPEAWARMAGLAKGVHWLWQRPAAAEQWTAHGEAERVSGTGVDRMSHVSGAIAKYQLADGVEASMVRWFGGASFAPGACQGVWDGFPEALFVLPRLWAERGVDGAVLHLQAVVHPGDDVSALHDQICQELADLESLWRHGMTQPPCAGLANPAEVEEVPAEAEWGRQVAAAIDEIQKGRYRKVVLARVEQVSFTHEIDMARVVSTLAERYPDSRIYGVRLADRWFVGASPEQLVCLNRGKVTLDCLAGTAPRGDSQQADAELLCRLMEDPKEREEHALVLEWIREQIADLTYDIRAGSQPGVRKLRNVQHLHTPVAAEARAGVGILDLVSRLHPTPAVAGVPRDDAMAFIRTHEAGHRGWYAGPFGWMDGAGNGEFAVALRCALVRGRDASLFAGAGIMAESEPCREWVETSMKLDAMRVALLASREGDSQ